uniref:Reverse transcriptase n=1 Tax=Trachysalambria curvirostris nimavirus TaxID=2984282 RepID=A0A9C7BN38_9VIRU|nr:MAG: reverse transcriptase [Trachysalambria curvirostris nimavirus]
MERMGVCSKASSPWASPLHMVRKSAESWRPCGDYRRLNLITEPDHYRNIGTTRVFSKLDLLKGYFQVSVHPEDVPKTAIVTPFGSYVFHYSTFGLRNSGATFQIFGQLPYCVVYKVEAVLQFPGPTSIIFTDHKPLVSALSKSGHAWSDGQQRQLSAIAETGCTMRHLSGSQNPVADSLSRVEIPSIQLGVDYKAMAAEQDRDPETAAYITAIINLRWERVRIGDTPVLCDISTGRPRPLVPASFRRQIFGLIHDLAHPSIRSTIKLVTEKFVWHSMKKDLKQWTRSCEQCQRSKIHRHTRPQVHELPQPTRRFGNIHVDIVGPLPPSKGKRYLLTAIDRSAIDRSTRWPKAIPMEDATARSCAQALLVSWVARFGLPEHITSDRGTSFTSELWKSLAQLLGVTLHFYKAMAAEQDRDPETAAYITAITHLRWERVRIGDTLVLCDISTGCPRPLVPASFRRQIFGLIHDLAHPSIRSIIRLVTEKFVWQSMKKDLKQWTRSCEQCQRSKIHRHTRPQVHELPQPTRRFGHIHVDIVGPLPPSEGKRYLFTAIDRSTCWPEAIPMEDATARSCAQALLVSWVARFGLPEHITSDRGTSFTSELWKSLEQLLGVTLHFTTAYHPQSNGLVERWHRSLKTALTARCTTATWTSQLPWVLLWLRTTPKEDLQHSAAEMVYGQPLVVPGEFFPADGSSDARIEDLRRVARQFAPCRPTYRSPHPSYVPPDLYKTDFVFVREDAHRQPLSCPYRGPFRVLERAPRAFKIQLEGRADWISMERLKPAYSDVPDQDHCTYTRSGRPSHPPSFFSR